MNELLPCPFCGKAAWMTTTGPDDYQIECANSACTCFVCARTKEAAIAVWNNRPHEAVQAQEIARLTADVERESRTARIENEARVEAEAKIARLTIPAVYVGAHYSPVDLPEICPECDGRDFISHGVTGMVCKSCWLTAELDKAEAERDRWKALTGFNEAAWDIVRGALADFNAPAQPTEGGKEQR